MPALALTAAAAVALCAPANGAADAGLDSATSARLISANESRPLGADSGWLQLGANAERSGPESPAGALSRGGNSFIGNELLNVIGPLAVVLGIMGAAAYLVRRLGGSRRPVGGAHGLVEVLGRYPIARDHAAIVLRFDRRILLLHQSGRSMSTLGEITDEAAVQGLLDRLPDERRAGFAERLALAMRRRDLAPQPENPFQYIETVDLTRAAGALRGGIWPRGGST